MKKFSRKSSFSAPPTAILTADWHIRPTVPVCRTDNFLEAMWKKVDFIFDLAVQYHCPILMAGDLVLKTKWPHWLEEKFIGKVKEKKIKIYLVPGQHDLPDHNLEFWRDSVIGVLHTAGAITLLGVSNDYWPYKYSSLEREGLEAVFSFPFGVEISGVDIKKFDTGYEKKPFVALAHTLVTERAPEKFLIERARSAMSLLEKYPEYDLILTGDNHKPFIQEHDGRLLVNPGSLMRTAADQADHKPRVYLWYHEDNRVEPVYLPIEEGIVDRTHIDLQEAKDERIEAYVSRLSEEVEIGLSFEGNLESYFKSNRVRKPVQDKVWASMPK